MFYLFQSRFKNQYHRIATISPEFHIFLNSGEIAVVGLVSPRLLHRLICLDFFFHNRRRILRRLSFIRFSLKDDIQGKPLLNNQQAKTQGGQT